jgi:hypothetical protein
MSMAKRQRVTFLKPVESFTKDECDFLLELLSDYDDCLRDSGYAKEYKSVLKKLDKMRDVNDKKV